MRWNDGEGAWLIEPGDPFSIFEVGMDRDLPKQTFAPRNHTVLNLGSGNKQIHDAIDLDRPAWDAHMQIPFADDTVDIIYAFHFFEHLDGDTALGCLKDCERVLREGGMLWVVVPYGVSDCAIQDLDHKSRFNEDTWKNTFANPYYNKGEWKFTVGFNMIMGLNHRNLVLVSQLLKA